MLFHMTSTSFPFCILSMLAYVLPSSFTQRPDLYVPSFAIVSLPCFFTLVRTIDI